MSEIPVKDRFGQEHVLRSLVFHRVDFFFKYLSDREITVSNFCL